MSTTVSLHTEVEEEENFGLTLAVLGPSAVIIGVLIFLAVFGNVITICAFIIDKKLQTVYDFYIFNLAITDLLIGCVSMPFHAVYSLQDSYWQFGVAFCKIWLTIDFTLCLESVILILLLSYDRLQLLMLGPKYTIHCTMRKAYVKIAITWILAFLLYGPFIIIWDYLVGYSTVEPNKCDVEFSQNFEFTTVTAVIEFVIPVLSLAVLNYRVYRCITKRLAKQTENAKTVGGDISTVTATSSCNQNHQHDFPSSSSARNTRGSRITFNTSIGETRYRKSRRANLRSKRESKAARFLTILVLVFLTSWAPYTITTMIVSFCNDCVNGIAYEAMNWLLWGKSAINPFIYAMNSSRYRYNFKRFLCLCRSKTKIQPENVEITNHTGGS